MIDAILKNKLLVVVGLLLLGFGLVKPNLGNFIPSNNNSIVSIDTSKVSKPSDPVLLEACGAVTKALQDSASRKTDGVKLASLYHDLASLIALDGEDQTIKSTLEIREANRLAGSMCRLNLGGKYPDLADACEKLVVAGLGDSESVLDTETRKRAVDTFMALSWACYEGSK